MELTRVSDSADWQFSRSSTPEPESEVDLESISKADRSAVELVPVRSLLPAFSPRIEGEDDEHIKMLADIGTELPPILVHRPTMRVIDGMHRLGAAKMRGDHMIKVQFFERSEREAFVLSVKLNIAHGRPLSLADRTRAAERIIESYPRWSDRSIAAAAGLSARSVADVRARMGTSASEEITARIGRDGRVRPLDPAGGRLRALDALKSRPGASLREIARIAGVSPATALDVRNRMNRGEEPVPPAARRPARERSNGLDYNETRDVSALLRGLTNDPSLRFSDAGRDLLRWMHTHCVADGEWRALLNEVPPHCAYIVAAIARQVAGEWLDLAGEVGQIANGNSQ